MVINYRTIVSEKSVDHGSYGSRWHVGVAEVGPIGMDQPQVLCMERPESAILTEDAKRVIESFTPDTVKQRRTYYWCHWLVQSPP